jgi:hypothetical protein
LPHVLEPLGQAGQNLRRETLDQTDFPTIGHPTEPVAREAIVKVILQLSEADAAKFWPIYKEYDAERAKLDKAEAELIQDYAKAYETISNEKAEELLNKSFKIDAQRVELAKKYFNKVKAATSATTAAKFIEVEKQLEDVAGLQAASVLPANPPNQ